MRKNIIGFFQFLRLVMVIVSISIVHVPTAKAESCKANFEILPPVLGGPCPNPLTKEQNVIVTWPGKTEVVTLKGTGSCCDVCEDCKPAPIAYCFDQKSKGVWPSFGVPLSDDDGNVTMEVKDMVCSVSDTDCTLNVTPPLSPITIPVPGKTHTMSGQEGADRTETRPSPCSTPPSNPPGGGGGGGGYVCTPYYYMIDSYDCNYNYTQCNYLGSSYGGYAGCW